MSKKYSLNKQDLKRVIRQIVIIYSPVFILFLNQIQNWQLDIKIVYALILSTTIDITRRYITDYTKVK